MNIVTSYFLVRHLAGAMQLGNFSATPSSGGGGGGRAADHFNADARHQRQMEYLECLWRNTQHPEVEAVHLIVEGMHAYQHFCASVLGTQPQPEQQGQTHRHHDGCDEPWCRPWTWSKAQRRKIIPFLRLAPGPPTYADLFGYANLLLPGKLVMVANADVYLSEELLGSSFDRLTTPAPQSDTAHTTSTLASSFSLSSSAAPSCGAEKTPEAVRAALPNRPHGKANHCRSTRTPVRAMGNLVLQDPTAPGRASRREEGQAVALALTRYEVEPLSVVSNAVLDSHTHAPPTPQSQLLNALLPHIAPLIADYRGSHDAFVLQPPVPQSFLRAVGHKQNCYQAENIVVYELQRCGYTVLNPCLSIGLVHRHEADLRQWFPSVDPSRYGRAAPVTLARAMEKATEAKCTGNAV